MAACWSACKSLREKPVLRNFLANLGYRHWDESQNPYRLFLA